MKNEPETKRAAPIFPKSDLAQTLMDHLPDQIYFKDLESRFIAVNRMMATRCGYQDPVEMIGKTDFDLYTEEHARQAFYDEQTIIRTGEPIVAHEEKETWPDGHETWVSTTKVPLRDNTGHIIGTFGVSRDISTVKRLERALAAERNLLHGVLNQLPDPIYVKDTHGRYLLDNLAHRELIGMAEMDDVVGKNAYDFFPREVAEHFQNTDKKVLKSGEPLIDHEELARDAVGEERWFLTTKVPLYDDGRVAGLVCIGHDITERKRVRAKLAAFTEELRARNESLEEDLALARELQSSMLPQHFPCFPANVEEKNSAVQFHHFYSPSMMVSGDFFDVLEISDTTVGVFICDVMGHGVRAAMVAAIWVRTLVGELRPLWNRPGQLLSELNRGLYSAFDHGDASIFVTAFYVVVDIGRAELRYSNAGHPCPMQVHRAANSADSVPLNGVKPGPVLGLFADAKYPESVCALTAHDIILLFTDGLFEVESEQGQAYDYGRLLRLVNRRGNLPASELCRGVIEEVQNFSATHEFSDDVCMIAVEVDHLIAGTESSV